MQVSCKQCGRKYRVSRPPAKGKKAQFECDNCGGWVTVIGTGEPGAGSRAQRNVDIVVTTDDTLEETIVASRIAQPQRNIKSGQKTKGPSLRMKMMVLFMVLPIVLMAAASVFYLTQLNSLSVIITDESSKVASSLAETIISNKADAVADQVRMFAESNRETSAPKLAKNDAFKAIAVQPVGETGYTALYELPDADGVWRTWAHVNDRIIGIDMSTLAKPLGPNFPGFWKIFSGVKDGKDSRGYYTWQDKDGKVREKFMVCKIVPGTNMVVASTTYLDEFTRPVDEIRDIANGITSQTRLFTAIALVGTLIIIGFVVSSYGYKITEKIRQLTGHATRISTGDLDSELKVKSSDEIGDLAEAISLMQSSIRLSIARLSNR